ncbi:MAG: hypothetical protein Ct9H300mP16_18440 [Pseudomonadota bacterium]|nr:MAG: hypothetical protein Ct9H300mP16_18440 [Pseudomonadota bacterium]
MELSLRPPVRPALCHVIAFAAVLLQTACQSSDPQPDSPAASIRFYNVNSQNQQRELYLLPNRNRAGCFNLPVSVDVYRVAQIGFEYCSIYSGTDCDPASAHRMYWSGKARKDPNKKKPTTVMTEGAMWRIEGAREAALRSWECILNTP